MIQSIQDCVTLANGVRMPWLGFGTYRLEEGQQAYTAVRTALEVGYRSVDTAAMYGNEVSVGRAIRESGIPREEIFLATKVWNSDQGYESTLRAFDASRKRLGLDVIDLYLIHWPAVPDLLLDTWRALEKLHHDGKARAIGVCNCHVHHLKEILAHCEIKPMVDQVEFHPYLGQAELRAFCPEEGIQMEAWAPLMKGAGMRVPETAEIGRRHGKTPAQVLIRWVLQHAVVAIPKSAHKDRIIENSQVFDFELTAEEMAILDGLDRGQRSGPNPDALWI